jgi:hypothetical protein
MPLQKPRSPGQFQGRQGPKRKSLNPSAWKAISLVEELVVLFETIQFDPTASGLPPTGNLRLCPEEDLTFAEVEKAINTTNLNSALGFDNIPTKALKLLWHSNQKENCFNVLKACWNNPEQFNRFKFGIVRPVAKPTGGFRPITLLSHFDKIIDKILAPRLSQHLQGRHLDADDQVSVTLQVFPINTIPVTITWVLSWVNKMDSDGKHQASALKTLSAAISKTLLHVYTCYPSLTTSSSENSYTSLIMPVLSRNYSAQAKSFKALTNSKLFRTKLFAKLLKSFPILQQNLSMHFSTPSYCSSNDQESRKNVHKNQTSQQRPLKPV